MPAKTKTKGKKKPKIHKPGEDPEITPPGGGPKKKASRKKG
jgi:hypothetical protein